MQENVSQKSNDIKFRTGTLYTQKLAISLAEPLVHCARSVISQTAFHMLSGCQNASI